MTFTDLEKTVKEIEQLRQEIPTACRMNDRTFNTLLSDASIEVRTIEQVGTISGMVIFSDNSLPDDVVKLMTAKQVREWLGLDIIGVSETKP